MKYRGPHVYMDSWGSAYAEHRDIPPPSTRRGAPKTTWTHRGTDGDTHDIVFDRDDITFKRQASGRMAKWVYCRKCRIEIFIGENS